MAFAGVALVLTASFWQAYTCIPSNFPATKRPPALNAHPAVMRAGWVAACIAGLLLLFAADVLYGVGAVFGYCFLARLVSIPVLQHTVYRS